MTWFDLVALFMAAALGAMGGLAIGWNWGYDACKDIWDPSYKPIKLKHKDHEDFKAWQELKHAEEDTFGRD